MLWVKAFHIVSVVSWFAMLFYLPRLFVYHAMAEDTIGKERFKVMERKLYRAIGTPAMIATLVTGAWTASYAWDYYFNSVWFWIKVSLVILLVGYHHVCGAIIKRFANDQDAKTHIYYRWFNEFPTIILVAVVLLVVLKQPA